MSSHTVQNTRQHEERRSTGAVLLAIVLTAALTGGIIYRWHYIIVRNLQDEARAAVAQLHNEVSRLTKQLKEGGSSTTGQNVTTREHIIFQIETNDAHRLNYNEYSVTYPKNWTLERDPNYSGNGFRVLFKDENGRRLVSMNCPFAETFPFDAWSFKKSSRTVEKSGVPYRIELWEGTPRAADTVPRSFIFAGPIAGDRTRIVDAESKTVQGCQFSTIDTTFDAIGAQGMDLLFQSLEVR